MVPQSLEEFEPLEIKNPNFNMVISNMIFQPLGTILLDNVTMTPPKHVYTIT